MAASELGDEMIRAWITDALTSNPELLPHLLIGCADVSEQRDSRDIRRLIGISYGFAEVPTWFPVHAVATAIREQGGATSGSTPDTSRHEALNQLAAAILNADTSSPTD